jgi:RNA polymerase sigma factor (sigma-70 family)
LLQGAVRKVVRRQRIPRSDADDIVSETMCKLVQRSRSEPSSVRSWLGYACQVARRECAYYRRSLHRRLDRAASDDTDALREIPAPVRGDPIASEASLAQARETLRASLRSAHQLAVFQLHFELRVPAVEVARALGHQVQHVNRDIAAILARARNLWTTWTAEHLSQQRSCGTAAASS